MHINTVRAIAAAGMLAGLAEPAPCQDPPPRDWANGSTRIAVGTVSLGLGSLNGALRTAGKPSFTEDPATIGISTTARFGRFFIGATGSIVLPQRETTTAWNSRLSGASTTFDAGVIAFDGARMTIAPSVSFGLRSFRLRFDTREHFDYDGGLSNPARGVELASFNGVAQAGIAVERRVSFRGSEYAIGVDVGANTPIGGPLTYSGDVRVGGAPRVGGGRYARISVGLPMRDRSGALAGIGASLLSMLSM